MSTNSRTSEFFIYPKDIKGKYTGHSIAVLLRNGRMYSGESICSNQDQFEKAVGRELAYFRAWSEYERDAMARNEPVEAYINPYARGEE